MILVRQTVELCLLKESYCPPINSQSIIYELACWKAQSQLCDMIKTDNFDELCMISC